MDKQKIEAFSKIPQPPRESFGFIEDIKSPLQYNFQPGNGYDPGVNTDCMANGAEIKIEFPACKNMPETAFASLRTVLKAKGIEEKQGTYPLVFKQDLSLTKEEYRIVSTPDGVTVAAADCDGLRRGVYYLEDRIREVEGKAVKPGEWQRKPFVKHRVSRCFFGPTNRPPFFIDELMNDVDYYPEEYLNKLAHEGVNGLWLTMYFRDLPSSLFPNHGKDVEKRFAKLRLTVERCARYGIRIYVFFSEPKLWGPEHYCVPLEEAKPYPEMVGKNLWGPFHGFCTSSETGKRYLEECMDRLFEAVPDLGGVINIMLGEDNGSCISHHVSAGRTQGTTCPVCSQKDDAESFSELAEMFANVIHKHNPEAEYIAWFYAPGQHDGSPFMQRLLKISEKWPDNCTLMFNFESGGASEQLGKQRIVLDYSLAYVGPSRLFAESADKAPRSGAKLQVGCSHEDASVPFIPVPENLYDKYKFMEQHNVSAAMQCWYFGNYPGLMNKAAGELSFEPFPAEGKDFLVSLAAPDWRKDAPAVADAWHYFSMAYRQFPSNLAFEWFGPLHHSIAWPMHLFPVDEPISPSWILKNFPEVSGDRIGECLCFHHTLDEALILCGEMSETWEKGMAILRNIRDTYSNDPARLADISLSEAVGLQMKSTYLLLKFYSLREDMLFNRVDHLAEMAQIVRDEIGNTRRMLELCEKDCRLGYHSEAEGYLFFPEKLRARIQLLEELLNEDFPKFDLNAAWIDEYTGAKLTGAVAECPRKDAAEIIQKIDDTKSWSISYDDDNFYLSLYGMSDVPCYFALETCRMWSPYQIIFDPVRVDRVLYAGPFISATKIVRSAEKISITIPRSEFDGFVREGFPMRVNVYGDDFGWVKNTPWPSRLLHVTFNPNCTGWLVLK
ncbi:MAG: hypothetical protein J6W81_05055 [Lentisphaeria bacterium]|nr:hypothetical protein [Lentisphaeria bacterium]